MPRSELTGPPTIEPPERAARIGQKYTSAEIDGGGAVGTAVRRFRRSGSIALHVAVAVEFLSLLDRAASPANRRARDTPPDARVVRRVYVEAPSPGKGGMLGG